MGILISIKKRSERKITILIWNGKWKQPTKTLVNMVIKEATWQCNMEDAGERACWTYLCL